MRPLRRAAAGILTRAPTSATRAPGLLRCSAAPAEEPSMTDPPADPNPAPTTGRDPMTEAQIQASWIGKIEPLTGPITFAEYDPGWPALFGREETRIRAVLGDRVVEIEHTGSTSVPGPAAKPVIDITMTVADVTDEPDYVPDLE